MTLDPRMKLIDPMLEAVPDGYFAVEQDEKPLTFIRLHLRTHGRRKGFRILQTQHSDDLVVRAFKYPNGDWWFIDREKTVVDLLIALVANHQRFAVLYGQTIGKCCRCGKTLTDERSRHYGIGPECEGKLPWVIELVNNQHDGKSYEELQYEV